MAYTWEEKIERIEKAPKEMQTMVAKAFIREDIEDENVQYTFNTSTMEELNEEGSVIENANAEAPEGIGAGTFSIRTYKPNGNKNFITTGSGGWSTCIKGYPMDGGANVLANCVGYASGRFNEIINEARGTTGCTYKTLNSNAEFFVDRARSAGLEVGMTPRVGAIMCWQNGELGGNGAGHVAIVERVYSNSSVYTSESAYGGTTFWNQNRTNSNGRWGIGSGHTFRGFIYLPADVQKVVDGGAPAPTPGPSGKFNIGDKVIINGPLYTNANASSPAGHSGERVTNITRKVEGTAHPYNTTGDLGWMDEASIKAYSDPTPAPATELQVGDTVKIIGTGNGSSYGNSNVAYGLGWTRQILGIYPDRPFPYRVGNNSGTTGFYAASALQRM